MSILFLLVNHYTSYLNTPKETWHTTMLLSLNCLYSLKETKQVEDMASHRQKCICIVIWLWKNHQHVKVGHKSLRYGVWIQWRSYGLQMQKVFTFSPNSYEWWILTPPQVLLKPAKIMHQVYSIAMLVTTIRPYSKDCLFMKLNVQWTCKYSTVTWISAFYKQSPHCPKSTMCNSYLPYGKPNRLKHFKVYAQTSKACSLMNANEDTQYMYDAKNKISTLNYKDQKIKQ